MLVTMLVNIYYVDELTVERLKTVWLNTENPKHESSRGLFVCLLLMYVFVVCFFFFSQMQHKSLLYINFQIT